MYRLTNRHNIAFDYSSGIILAVQDRSWLMNSYRASSRNLCFSYLCRYFFSSEAYRNSSIDRSTCNNKEESIDRMNNKYLIPKSLDDKIHKDNVIYRPVMGFYSWAVLIRYASILSIILNKIHSSVIIWLQDLSVWRKFHCHSWQNCNSFASVH